MDEKKTSILVIDDEEEIVYCLKNFLARKGYTTDGASSGEEALQKLSEKNVDVILLDIVMPGLKGTEVAKIVREKYPDVKIVLATAFPKEIIPLDNQNIAEAILKKPFRLHELYEKVEEVINRPEGEAAEKVLLNGIETKILFVKAKLLIVGAAEETYVFLRKEFRELSAWGQYYELDFAANEEQMNQKLKFSPPDIVIFEEIYLNQIDSETPANILLNHKEVNEVTAFNLAVCMDNNELLDNLYRHIRHLCIKNSLIEIR